MEWMLMPLRRYADFSGRSRRMEYWMYALLQVIVYIVAYALILAGGGLSLITAGLAVNQEMAAADQVVAAAPGPLFWVGCIALLLWLLATIIPSLAVTVRRLHDRNMSGWYLLGFIVVVFVLAMIPVLGTLVVLLLEIGWIVLMALPGTPGPNKYGPDPLGQVDPEVFA
jgi:uncharacterized membrane protein YhaH (DUF805 family)